MWNTEAKWRAAGQACDNIFARAQEEHKRAVAAGLACEPTEADMEEAKRTDARIVAYIDRLRSLAKQNGEL